MKRTTLKSKTKSKTLVIDKDDICYEYPEDEVISFEEPGVLYGDVIHNFHFGEDDLINS